MTDDIEVGLLRFFVSVSGTINIEATDSYDGFRWTTLDTEEMKQLRDWLNAHLLTGDARALIHDHVERLESKLGERDQEIARLTEIVDDATIRLDDRQKRLDSMAIHHPTDVCACRFDFSDGMKVRNVCDYHNGIADRLDRIRRALNDHDMAAGERCVVIQHILVEKHRHLYGDDGRCECGIHALD